MEVLAIVIGIAVILVGLAISIAWHELGHLIPAKLFGVRVGQYMIGFGPTLWSKKIGETEYGFKALPFGGYISMAGMFPPARADAAATGRAGGGFFRTMVQDARSANEETIAGADERTFYRLAMWKRIIIMLGGPVMNLILAIIIFTIVFSGIGVQRTSTTLDTVQPCVTTSTTATCETDAAPSPAAAAGLRPGDRVVSIDGTKVAQFADLVTIVTRSPGKTLQFVIDRDGAQQTLPVTPAAVERTVKAADGTSTKQTVGSIGVVSRVEYDRKPILTGADLALQNTGQVMGMIVQLPVKLFDVAASLVTGAERDPNGPLSVVGVGVAAGEVATSDTPIVQRISFVLSLVGSLNIALFVFNLIPLLPLDGGHVAIALWDGVRRGWAKLFRRPPPKPVDATKLVPITFVVVVAMVAMGALLIIADIFNPMQLFR